MLADLSIAGSDNGTFFTVGIHRWHESYSYMMNAASHHVFQLDAPKQLHKIGVNDQVVA